MSLGNHDAKMIFDDPTAIWTAALALPGVTVADRGAPAQVDLGEVVITIVPWMKSDAELYATLDALAPDPDRRNLLFLHVGLAEIPEFAALVPGSQTLTRSQVLGLLPRFEHIWAGHFHKYREFLDLRYTSIGSPERASSAEAGTPKGYLVYDTDTRTTAFHPIPTRSWYNLGILDATDWDATRLLTELEGARTAIVDLSESIISAKIAHISTAAWASLDVRAYKRLKGSAFAATIDTSFDDPALAGAERPAEGEQGEDSPVLRDLPTEWAEHVASVRTRRESERSRVAVLGLAALEHRDLLGELARLRSERESGAALVEPVVSDAATTATAKAGTSTEADLVPAAPEQHELAKSRRKTAPKTKKADDATL